MTTKQRVQEILDRLPDDCSLDDVLYEVYVIQKIERGLAEAEAGETISHEDVAEDLRRRWFWAPPGSLGSVCPPESLSEPTQPPNASPN